MRWNSQQNSHCIVLLAALVHLMVHDVDLMTTLQLVVFWTCLVLVLLPVFF